MFLFGKTNFCRRNIGVISQRECPHCNNLSYWELCIVTTWFRILFVPIFPLKTIKCLVCNNCDYCLEIDEQTFLELQHQIYNNLRREEPDALKYINKNELQINYIKTLQSSKH